MRNFLRRALILATVSISIVEPVGGQVPDAFCWTPGQATHCRTYLVTETGLPVQVVDDAFSLGLDWKIGLMLNVQPEHAIGGVLTLVGVDDDYNYSGLELRYRRWAVSGVAGEVALGGAWVRPKDAFTGSRHFRSHVRIGLWINEYIGAFFGGTAGDGVREVTGGPQIASWPGLVVGAALIFLPFAALR